MTISITASDPFDTETNVGVNKIVSFTLESDAGDIDLGELNVQMDPIGEGLVDVITAGLFEPGWEGPSSSVSQGVGPEEIIVEIEYESLPYLNSESISVNIQADESGGGAPFSEVISFVTEAAAPVTDPVFTSHSPAPGATDVDPAGLISVTIDAQNAGESFDLSSLQMTVGAVAAVSNGVVDSGFDGPSANLSGDGTDTIVIVLDPSGAPLPGGTLTEVTADINNGNLDGPWLPTPYDFTTAAAASGVSFANQDPAADATGVAISTGIAFDLVLAGGDNLDTSTLSVSVGPPQAILNGVFQAGYTGTITGDGTPTLSVTINPDSDLDAETGIPISTTVDDDVLGGPYNQNYSFTTAAADSEPPVLGNPDPADSATDVQANPFVWTFEFTDASGVDQSSINARLKRVTDNTYEDAVLAGVVQAGWTEVSITVITDGFRYVIQRDARLDYETDYSGELDAGDLVP